MSYPFKTTVILSAVTGVILCMFLMACHEDMRQKAEREAEEYTLRNCPTPYINNTRTDSCTFNRATGTYTTYCSVTGMIDDSIRFAHQSDELRHSIVQAIRENTQLKSYKRAGFHFRYVCHSSKEPEKVLWDVFIDNAEVTP